MLDFDAVFLSVLNMSVTASYIILAVILVRFFLRKAPKVFSYALWSVVLLRLLCPFTFESVIGLLPSGTEPIPQDIVYEQTPQIDTGIHLVDNTVNAILPPVTNPEASVNPLQIWVFMGRCIWLLGIAVMVIYSVVTFIKLKRKLIGAVPLQDNIYIADHIDSPFVMGFINPKIYLPSNLAENERAFIIQHEQTHINRLDYLTRILAFAALCRHWFDPLVWVAFVLSGKDMETSCDEAVMRTMGLDIRADYAEALLKFASGKKLIAATPLAFGEGDTKGRIHNVMRYKKPVVWVSVLLVILITVLAFAFGTNASGSIFKRDTMKQAQNLSVSSVAKIELVTFPNSGNGYHLFEESEFAEIVAFINESDGRHIASANVQQITGGGQTLYITNTDGNILTVGNCANVYLYIQDDCFKTSKEYLARFEEFIPTDPIPEDFHYGQYVTPEDTESASSAIISESEANAVSIQVGNEIFHPAFYPDGFQFDYESVPVLTVDKTASDYLIRYGTTFVDIAYWGMDTYHKNNVERRDIDVTIHDSKNYLHITDGDGGYIPDLDCNADFAFCWVKPNVNEEAEYVFKVEFNHIASVADEVDSIQVILSDDDSSNGNKSKTITDPAEVAAFVAAFETVVVDETTWIDIPVAPPSYYRLYDGENLVKEYMFHANDTGIMWVEQTARLVTYEGKTPYELYQASNATEDVIYQEVDSMQVTNAAKN